VLIEDSLCTENGYGYHLSSGGDGLSRFTIEPNVGQELAIQAIKARNFGTGTLN